MDDNETTVPQWYQGMIVTVKSAPKYTFNGMRDTIFFQEIP